ncbi:rhamnogalacturonan acetylesterase, partial [bacterium]|nr:rhamnogalacturonan acetylesterase [bacterium]
QYIDQARAREVIPVLVTPMHRRAFGPDGRIGQRLTPYAVAMREVAAEKKTPCVDLYEASGLVMQKLGPDGCLPLFCNPKDFAHFSGKGATLMADLVAREMKRLDIGLSAHVILPAIPDENKP